jgi:hypothetical protein
MIGQLTAASWNSGCWKFHVTSFHAWPLWLWIEVSGAPTSCLRLLFALGIYFSNTSRSNCSADTATCCFFWPKHNIFSTHRAYTSLKSSAHGYLFQHFQRCGMQHHALLFACYWKSALRRCECSSLMQMFAEYEHAVLSRNLYVLQKKILHQS